MSSSVATAEEKSNDDNEPTSIVPNEVNLHDCLAIGEIERGLSSQQKSNRRAMQEIQRLPIFLRVLSLTRPQSSISVFGNESQEQGDKLVNTAVERLEDVVAKHSVAEGVDVVTCHLAPSVTRKLSKVPPLQRKQGGEWDTKELAAVARNPRSSKRKRKVDDDDDSKKETDDGIQGSSEDEADGDEMEEDPNQLESLPNKKQRKGNSRRDSAAFAAEDSQEATVTKTLSELASLVVTSLEPIKDSDDADEVGKPGLSLTIDDSILSESAAGAAESGGGAMEGSDLGSTVSSIMHHAPVLRSRQVANALCRASTPQGGALMSRMGANCPASVPSLLLGCIQAYSMAVSQGNTSICNVAKKSVTALAKLSTRECCTVLTKLQSSGIMLDIQLQLAMETDPIAASCLLVNNLSVVDKLSFELDKPGNPSEDAETSTQAAGDASSDFRALEEIDDNRVLPSGVEPPLLELLSTNRGLCKGVFIFLSKELNGRGKITTNQGTGKLCLTLRALSMLLLVPGAPSPKFDYPGFLLDTVLDVLQELIEAIEKNIPQPMEAPESSLHDNLVNLVRCCVLLTIAQILSNSEVPVEAAEKCKESLKLVRSLPCVSRRALGFRYCLDYSTKRNNPLSMFTQTVNMVSATNDRKIDRSSGLFPTLEAGMKKMCKIFMEEFCDDLSADHVSLNFVSSALRIEMSSSYEQSDNALVNDIKPMLQKILNCDTILEGENVPRFVFEATDFLNARESLQIPMVLSSELEKYASQLNLCSAAKTSTLNPSQNRFLLQLLHALKFLDLNQKSPFVFDPRSFPMKEAIYMLGRTDYTRTSPFLEKKLWTLVGKHCPEMLAQARRSALHNDIQTSPFGDSRREVKTRLLDTIRSCVESSGSENDCCGAEEAYLSAKAKLSDADLYSTVIGAFLASPHKPPPKYSYALACRDPLALFKCPLRVWRHRELRRIAVATLSSLLETNKAITMNTSPLEDSAEELLAARNTLTVRCLLFVAGGSSSEMRAANCSMTTSLIRSLVAGQRGLIATLVKQGLDETTLDWLIESVPETMNDSQDLLQILAQQSALTAAEKLRVADAVIRIAIINGQSNEIDAATMVYSALAVLIDSFFLVIGPVGVPVNALMSSDNSGLDVTQIARNAAFRILKSLLLVRGRRSRVRKECGMALQKLAGLCKGESASSGVAGAVAGRRKALLKEIFDAVMRAANAMGSSVGSSSTAA